MIVTSHFGPRWGRLHAGIEWYANALAGRLREVYLRGFLIAKTLSRHKIGYSKKSPLQVFKGSGDRYKSEIPSCGQPRRIPTPKRASVILFLAKSNVPIQHGFRQKKNLLWQVLFTVGKDRLLSFLYKVFGRYAILLRRFPRAALNNLKQLVLLTRAEKRGKHTREVCKDTGTSFGLDLLLSYKTLAI